MNLEQPLNQLAEKYRNQGYTVVVRPGPDQLPSFARDFQVELLACRKDGNVLVTVKANQADMAADSNLSRYAEVIERQPGWRYDLFVLGSDRQMVDERREAPEQSRDDTLKALDEAENMLAGGFAAQSLIAAWAALESAMRQTLRAQGSRTGWATSSRALLNESVSSGTLSIGEFQDLERLFDLRNGSHMALPRRPSSEVRWSASSKPRECFCPNRSWRSRLPDWRWLTTTVATGASGSIRVLTDRRTSGFAISRTSIDSDMDSPPCPAPPDRTSEP